MTNMVDNILKVYRDSSREDREGGMKWYATARGLCEDVAETYRIQLDVVAAIVAVLSPRLPWEKNMEAAVDVIEGRQPSCLRTNADKARIILANREPRVSGPKVSSFFANIMGDSQAVTVDTWAARVALGDWTWKGSVGEKLYREIADAYRAAADKVGLPPSQVQAVTWVSIRRRATGREEGR